MRIDSAAPAAHTPPPRRSKAEEAAAPPAAPAPAAEAGRTSHGRGAEHRSDVATVLQWINHPDLRESLVLPDLQATHNGKGFANAVAAYQAVLAELTPPVTEEPVPPEPTDVPAESS